jgi:hypothetical protein
MPRRNSPNEIHNLSDLSRLGDIVFDKRLGQRAAAKKNRRNRHVEKQFIRHTLAHRPATDGNEGFGDEQEALPPLLSGAV